MSGNLQVSARSLVSLLASIFGPSIYDAPPFGRGDLGRRGLLDLISSPQPDPWRAVALNPQPLPPKALYALALADKYIDEVLALDRVGALLGGEVTERAQDRALRLIAEIDELCPRCSTPAWTSSPYRSSPGTPMRSPRPATTGGAAGAGLMPVSSTAYDMLEVVL